MYASRKQCEALIKMGKIKSDTEIREFKRKLKTSRIS
jgi:16S rRNA U516 pseudouridylate synthase RsuA-like enzyme